MEFYVLILFSLICLHVLYKQKKDIMCPSIALTLGYIITFICGLFNYHKWNSNISLTVIVAVFIGLLSFYAGDFLVQKMFKRHATNIRFRRERVVFQLRKMYIKPLNWTIFVAIIISLISTYLIIQDVIRIASINYRQWGNLIYNYRHNRSVSSIAAIPRMGNLFTTGLAFSYIFVFINNLFSMGKLNIKVFFKNFVFLIPAILYSVQIIFLGGRIGVALCLIEIVVVIGILKYFYNGSNLTINIKRVLIVVLALSCFGSFFFRVQEFVGRDQQSDGAIDYITTYLGASMELFSLYVNDASIDRNDVETLTGIVDNAQRYLDILHTIPIESNLEFRQSSSGIELGNVYSGFRNYYNDMGFVGIILFSFILSFVFNSIYYSIRGFAFLNIRRIVLILFYSSYFYCIVFHFFTDYFFINISVNMILKLMFIAISCYAIYKGKIRI